MTKEKSLCFCFFLFFCFFFSSHILSLCLTAKEKHSSFSLLSHTLYLEGCNTFSSLSFFSSYFSFPFSSPWLFSQSGIILLSPPPFFFFFFSHNSHWLFSQRWQYFALSPLVIFFKAATLCSFLLAYLLEGGDTLLSRPCLPPKRKSLFSLFVSHSIFSFPIERTLGTKPSNSL